MKAIFKLGWREYVLEVEEAASMLEILMKAERYEKHYDRDTEIHTYHVWRDVDSMEHELTLITEDRYRAAKLVGKYEEKK